MCMLHFSPPLAPSPFHGCHVLPRAMGFPPLIVSVMQGANGEHVHFFPDLDVQDIINSAFSSDVLASAKVQKLYIIH